VTVTVRAATVEDLETVVSLRVDFLGAVRGPDFRPSDGFVERTRSFVMAEHHGGRLHTWIAEEGSEPVGIVSVLLWSRPPQPEDARTTEAYIINMYVPPAHQRQGIGRRLLDCCLESAEELGIRKFLLHSTDEGQALYESSGFAPKVNWMELPVSP
jgi:ribosomal protein S18 acetylase RimI-like enzyme